MKRNSVMSIVGGLILLSSCHDLDLNPLAKGSTETWYSTETEITMAVNFGNKMANISLTGLTIIRIVRH